MENITELLKTLPGEAKDLVLNTQKVLEGESLDSTQTWGVALASAYYIGNEAIIRALLADAQSAGLSAEALEDARAAASLMGMNTIYYRFRHIMRSEHYNTRPANLKMLRMKQVSTTETAFELFSVGPAALAGCEMCLRAHEAAVLKGGLNHDNVHDAVRISSVLHGVAVALSTLIGRDG